MKKKKWASNSGYALLAAIIAVNIFAIFIFKAKAMWETEIQRDLEQELIFRGRQYVTAIEAFKKKNANANLKTLEELHEKKFLRKLYTDPMTESGEWNLVMRDGRAGKKGLLVVPPEMIEQYITRATIIGVCSSSPGDGFYQYRKKKKYFEWAFYLGEKPDKEMPELKYVGDPDYQEEEATTGSDNKTKSGKDGREVNNDSNE
ncbi:MAG: hypothetical protein GY940_22460 [bacterium]|nr:hypothetical protein [bacterium]